MTDCPAGKKSWPELIGRQGGEAEAIIERENRNVNAIVVPEGSPITLDLRCDRVRVFVDKKGCVVDTPVVG